MSIASMKLKRILGFTSNNQNSFLSQPNTGNIIYIAGCVVVILNPRLRTQAHLITNSKQTLTTLAISEDGMFLAAANCGDNATIYIWNLETMTLQTELISQQSEIVCMAFSIQNNLLVSVGPKLDNMLNIWLWRAQILMVNEKVASRIRAVSFAVDNSYFVTVGDAHVKFWYLLNFNDDLNYHSSSPVSITSKSVFLGELRKDIFCDVKCGRNGKSDSTFCITRAGLICELNNKRILHKWVDLRTSSAYCLGLSENLLVIGCANGVVRCFNTSELRFIRNLPRPHNLGMTITEKLNNASKQNGTHPNVISLGLDEEFNTVSCIYNDRSLYTWDMSDPNQVTKLYSAFYHSSCIWGVDIYPRSIENPVLPSNSFITCSSDDTLRIWDPSLFNSSNVAGNKFETSQILANESQKIIFTDSQYKFLCDLNSSSSRKNDLNYDSNEGLRCLKISPDGKHLAVGSRSGTIRIFDLVKDAELKNIAAHDAEVLCLEYSDKNNFDGFCYLASSSRDKLIHIFDVSNEYEFLQTIDDHSSSITALRFINNRAKDSLQLVSCAADKKIKFRSGQRMANGQLNFESDQTIEGKSTLYDMEVDIESSCLMTACQDCSIRLFNVAQMKYQSSFRGSSTEDGTLIKIALDPSCTFLATSSTGKAISIYDYQRGECIATVSHGLSDLVTDLKFTPDGRHLLACSGDGCIFIWKSPPEVANSIRGNLSLKKFSMPSSSPHSSMQAGNEFGKSIVTSKSSSSKLRALPDWAKQQMLDEFDRNKPERMVDKFDQKTEMSPADKFNRLQVHKGPLGDGAIDKMAGSNKTKSDHDEQSSSPIKLSSISPNEGHSPFQTNQLYETTLSESQEAKLFQSINNLERISLREKFVAQSLVHEDNTRKTTENNSGLSGLFSTEPSSLEQRLACTVNQNGNRNSSGSLACQRESRVASRRGVGARSARRLMESSDDERLSEEDKKMVNNRLVTPPTKASSRLPTEDGTSLLSVSTDYLREPHEQLNIARISGRARSVGPKLANSWSTQLDSNAVVVGLPSMSSDYTYCKKLDLSKLDPGNVNITHELCQHLADELLSLSRFTTRLHQRLQAAEDIGLSSLLARSAQSSMDVLSIMVTSRVAQANKYKSQVNLKVGPVSQHTQTMGPQFMRPPRSKSTLASRKSELPAEFTSNKSGGSALKVMDTSSSVHLSDRSAHKGRGNRQLSGSSIDHVLEAYSDRLFRMVQERMVDSNNLTTEGNIVERQF